MDRKTENLYINSAFAAAEREPFFALRRCESPIEKLMCRALWSRGHWTDRLEVSSYASTLKMLYDEACCIVPKPALGVQIELEQWRVDFLAVAIFSSMSDPIFVAVECDGHEYHEKTKEQARRDKSRDRALMASHVRVMRFTGSEIWKDPGGCAEEVLDYLNECWCREQPRIQADYA